MQNDLIKSEGLGFHSDGLVYLGIHKGGEIRAVITVRKEHYYGRAGWELKDCVYKGLPQEYRFELVRRVEKSENSKGKEAYVLYI